MNKVDLEVKNLILSYPTLFENRFDALNHIFTTSNYAWDENGCLATTCRSRKGTVKSMLKQLQDEEDKREAMLQETPICTRLLHEAWLVESQAKLNKFQFIAKNIDVFASTYCSVGHKEHWLWLYHNVHASFNYWPISHKPDVVDEDWREAIHKWAHELLPNMNSIMGYMDDNKGWRPCRGYEYIFNYVRGTWQKYASEQNIQHAREFGKVIAKILDEAEAQR